MGNKIRSGLPKGIKDRSNQVDLSNFKFMSWSQMQKWKQDLNQVGVNERIYVGTGDSFSINAYHRKNAGKQASGWVSLSEERIIRATKEIDSWMKPAPDNFQTVRAVSPAWLKDNFGTLSKHEVANIINTNSIKVNDAGFLSMSIDAQRNVFMNRGVVLHLGVSAGTPVFVTNNSQESEVIAHRNTETQFINAKVVGQTLHIYGILK